MPGTITPGQVFDHLLEVHKGNRLSSNLDKAAGIEDGVTGIVRGRALYLSVNQLWVMGIADGVMTCFALQGQNDFDTNGDVGNIQTNTVTALVATGAYELETTEYIAGAGDYDPNDALTVSNGLGTTGQLTPGTVYVDQICGVVSNGVVNYEQGVGITMLRFWPVWLPPVAP